MLQWSRNLSITERAQLLSYSVFKDLGALLRVPFVVSFTRMRSLQELLNNPLYFQGVTVCERLRDF